jgi:ketosteroid isomerase-like protein
MSSSHENGSPSTLTRRRRRPLWRLSDPTTFIQVLQDIAFGPRGIRAARVTKSAMSLRPGECQRTRPGVVFLAPLRVIPALLLCVAQPVATPATAQQRTLGEAERAAARSQLLATDSAHGNATLAEGLGTGFARYLADNAVYLEPGTDHLHGKSTIQAFLTRQPPGQSLSFHPALAEVSLDGAVGYTVGWTALMTGRGDSSTIRHGKYIAFWRRQADGSWKVEVWNRSGAQEAPATPPNPPARPPSRFHATRLVDPGAEIRRLKSVDSAFAAASVTRGAAEAFYQYAAPDALSLGGGKDFVVGREAIRDDQVAQAAPGQMLDWKPVAGGVGALGDLGWTVGEWRFTVPRNGKTATFTGKYLTIWARQPSGEWRFVADGGSSTPPAP